MHQTSVGGRCWAADVMNDVAPKLRVSQLLSHQENGRPCRIHTLGWYRNPSVALISSHNRIL